MMPVKRSDAKRLPDGSFPRGLPLNKICITVACDGNNVVCMSDGLEMSSRKRMLEAMTRHIKPRSVWVHDGDNSHNALVVALALENEVYTNGTDKGFER